VNTIRRRGDESSDVKSGSTSPKTSCRRVTSPSVPGQWCRSVRWSTNWCRPTSNTRHARCKAWAMTGRSSCPVPEIPVGTGRNAEGGH